MCDTVKQSHSLISHLLFFLPSKMWKIIIIITASLLSEVKTNLQSQWCFDVSLLLLLLWNLFFLKPIEYCITFRFPDNTPFIPIHKCIFLQHNQHGHTFRVESGHHARSVNSLWCHTVFLYHAKSNLIPLHYRVQAVQSQLFTPWRELNVGFHESTNYKHNKNDSGLLICT